jgi:4-hydroxy-2-oxovalerate aldolase
MPNPNLQILECTLRDGSYVIDFQFTVRDTMIIASALENAGFNLIEIGHGVGMNASNAGKGVAAATDEQYLEAAATALKRAKWGMFFIPGIGRHEDLELAARYGMNFVRIGTNATEVAQSKDFIEHAKRLGMEVSANLMKSYVLPPKELAEQARLSAQYGADVVCLVDSAGCMLPDDIQTYMAALQDAIPTPLGFHCHNNLAMGMANALTAIKCGAQTVDSTLQGMGRGGGNAATEVLVTILKKQGIDLGIDPNRLMDISTRIIKPMLKEKGLDSINVTLGYAGFHSSHLKTISKYAKLYGIDPRELIVAVCEVDRVDAPEDLVEGMARRLLEKQTGRSGLHIVSLPIAAFPTQKESESYAESLSGAARQIAYEIKIEATKRGTRSVLNIVAARNPGGKATVSRFIQEEFDHVIGAVQLDNEKQLREVIEGVDGLVDILFVDSDLKRYLDESLLALASRIAKKSQVLGYRDDDVWVRSVGQQITGMLSGVFDRRITICGTDHLGLKLCQSLLEQGAKVTLSGDKPEKLQEYAQSFNLVTGRGKILRIESDPVAAVRDAEVLVAFGPGTSVDGRVLEAMSANGIVFDAGIGSVSGEAVERGNARGLRIVRPDMRAALAGELSAALGTHRLTQELMGRSEIAGVPVVAGGLVGRYGEVVLDSVSNPTRVVGVADGHGKVIYGSQSEFAEHLAKVEQEILRRQVLAL